MVLAVLLKLVVAINSWFDTCQDRPEYWTISMELSLDEEVRPVAI